MDERLRRLVRKQVDDPSYIPAYLRELIRSGYLSARLVEYAAFLGDQSALQLFPHPQVPTYSLAPDPMYEPEDEARIRQYEPYRRMVRVINVMPLEQLCELSLRILESHYSDDRIPEAIALFREYLGGNEKVLNELYQLMGDIEHTPYEWSLTVDMDQDHYRMAAATFHEMMWVLESPQERLHYLRNNAQIDLLSSISLGGGFAFRIGYPRQEGEKMTMQRLLEDFIVILCTPRLPTED